MPAPTLYLLCGLPGSGKSTAARVLEAEGRGVRLNADEWVHQLYPADPEAAARDDRKGRVEEVQWGVAERLLSHGTSVILDWGLWTRSERDLHRARAGELGAVSELVFLDAPLEELWERLSERNVARPPGTFYVSRDELNRWATWFERPDQAELLIT